MSLSKLGLILLSGFLIFATAPTAPAQNTQSPKGEKQTGTQQQGQATQDQKKTTEKKATEKKATEKKDDSQTTEKKATAKKAKTAAAKAPTVKAATKTMKADVPKVEATKAGVASGILSMSRMVGGTFGVAAMGALVTGLGRNRIDELLPQLPPSARGRIAEGLGSGSAQHAHGAVAKAA